jgi:hypothetical protein
MNTFTRLTFPTLAIASLLAACTAATPSASGSPTAAGSAAAATSTAAASASAASGKYVDLQVVVPEPNARASIDGTGWTVDIIAKGNGPALDKVRPTLQSSSSAGRHPSFPGLVVMLKSSGAGGQAGNPNQNLARFFQIIGLPNAIPGTAGISSVTTAPSPSASAAASGSPATTATRTTADNQTAEATWFVQQVLWGVDVDVDLTAFVVDGDAPDVVSDRSALRIVSNEVTVRFHINGPSQPAGSPKPSGSASPSTAPSTAPSGSARPSASPSSTP